MTPRSRTSSDAPGGRPAARLACSEKRIGNAALGHRKRPAAQLRLPASHREDISPLAFLLTMGNPAGGPVGSRHRQQLNGEFIAALLRDFRHGGPKAIERVRRTQPAAYLKILALLVPREHKVQHTNSLKDLTDEQLEAMIEYLKTSLEAQAGGPVKVIEGMIESSTVPATALPVLEPPKRKPNRLMMEVDTAIGPQERKLSKRVPSPAST